MATEELDLEGIDPDSIVRDKVLAGAYHVAVSKINEDGGRNNDKIETHFEVQTAGPMHGRTHCDRTPKSHDDWARKKRLQLALCLGLVNHDQIKAAREARQPLRFDWQDGVGRHCGIVVVEETYEGNKQYKTPFADNIRQLNDPEIQPHVNRKAVQAASDEQDRDPFSDPAPAAGEKQAPAEESNPFA